MEQATPCDDLAIPVNSRDHVKGSREAPVILVEYGDYECPDCLNAWPIVRELKQEMGDRLGFVFRHFPQSSIHPHASFAAQAAEAAGQQGQYWKMHDALFARQQELATLDFTHLALELGLEVYQFESDLSRDVHIKRVREDYEGAVASGVKGTPTFFINGCRYRGRPDFSSLLHAVKTAAGTER